MPLEFYEIEQGIIKNMMLRKSHKDISNLIDCDIQDISVFLAAEIEDTDIITWQMKLDGIKKSKRLKKSKPPKEKKVIELKPTLINNSLVQRLQRAETKKQNELIQEFKRKKQQDKLNAEKKKDGRRPPAFKTIVVDYKKLSSIRIDKSTFIYSIPGEEEITKKKFLKSYKKPIDRYSHSINEK